MSTSSDGGYSAVVESFGDVLRQIPPSHFPEASGQVQAAVAAALNWFVIEAPEIAANHCVGIANPPVPDVMIWGDERLTVEKALRPASFRPYVTRLRQVVELCQRPMIDAHSALPVEDRQRITGGVDSSLMAINRELLGPLLTDFVYARSWLSTYGTKAGYWSYRWVGDCLRVAALESDASRVTLATDLREAAADALYDALAPETV